MVFALFLCGIDTFIVGSQPSSNTTQFHSTNIINLDSLKGRSERFNEAPQFFFAYQTSQWFRLSSVLPDFIKIPGLSLVFHHSRPRLYKIRFQGHVHTPAAASFNLVRVMVDNYLLIGNKLYPNTEHRFQMKRPSWRNDQWGLDWLGGVFAWSGVTANTFPCSKADTVYLPGGTHSIDVVARTSNVLQTEGLELAVELIELPEGSKTNLPLLYPSED